MIPLLVILTDVICFAIGWMIGMLLISALTGITQKWSQQLPLSIFYGLLFAFVMVLIR